MPARKPPLSTSSAFTLSAWRAAKRRCSSRKRTLTRSSTHPGTPISSSARSTISTTRITKICASSSLPQAAWCVNSSGASQPKRHLRPWSGRQTSASASAWHHPKTLASLIQSKFTVVASLVSQPPELLPDFQQKARTRKTLPTSLQANLTALSSALSTQQLQKLTAPSTSSLGKMRPR